MLSATYPPYSGRHVECCKCGHCDASSTWEAETEIGEYRWPERLDRRCTRCGYTWLEAPLDA